MAMSFFLSVFFVCLFICLLPEMHTSDGGGGLSVGHLDCTDLLKLDSVVCTIEDFSVFQSIWDIITAAL